MGLIAERDSGTAGYEAVEVPPRPAREDAAAAHALSVLRRTSARPSRRAVLYLHCADDAFVPDDLADWYTERGFHFYVADLRPREDGDRHDRHDGGKRLSGKALRACFEAIDSACAYLREAEGIDALIVSAHAAGAVAAALWCDTRRADRPADALVLTSPAFGRRDPGALDITCPVLVISPPGGTAGEPGREGKARKRGHRGGGSVQLGAHVTWLRLADGLGPEPARPAAAAASAADRMAGDLMAADRMAPDSAGSGTAGAPGSSGISAGSGAAGGAGGSGLAARGGASGTVTDIAAAGRSGSGTRLAAGGRIGASVRPVTPGRISVYPGTAGRIGIRPEARPGEPRPADDRQRFFDEMGRWLGTYMYGQVRDQLL